MAVTEFEARIRKETKEEILRMQAAIREKSEELATLRKFERAINPLARPRRKRRKTAAAA